VACRGRQFVDISLPPGSASAALNGVYRLQFGPANVGPETGAGSAIDELLGAGFITGLRIIRDDRDDGPLVMLVSF